ncbi:DUF2339 domain-containing protein [Chitinibacter tainanensis]|uniref:DUF2339 domain-containing protein n=1 Tax=Chitinibacter tainanensis TaxID=230667 RepID=UPI000422E521|nr:DUF2339 domain-containing protein [Chitinibacter tainanensis]
MLRWIFALLGLGAAWLYDLDRLFWLLPIAGFLVGRWFEQRSAAPAEDTAPDLQQADLQQLVQRVSRLEAEVAQLRARQARATTSVHPTATADAQTRSQPMSATPAAANPAIPAPVLPHGISANTTPTSPGADRELTSTAAAARNTAAAPAASAASAEALLAATQHPRQPSAPQPAEENPFWRQLQGWLLGGNTVVRLGMLILFVGVGFLLKFAADNALLPIEARLAGLVLGASVLFGFGWQLRESRRAYALILQGGALGLLYFTLYGALRLYQLLSPEVAFALLSLLGVAAAFLSVRQDASPLAVMGICGGFLAPILTSTGGGQIQLLLGYYALLNAGIFAIAWFKAWRGLNLLGFGFTFGVLSLWLLNDYQPTQWASVQPFVVLFWLFYTAIAVLHALRQPDEPPSKVDATLVFGTPLITLALQARLMDGVQYGLCYSAIIAALLYFGLAYGLKRQQGSPTLRLLAQAELALGVLLATLAIPLAFGPLTTAAAWAVEGAGVVWLSLRQGRQRPLLFGLALQFIAALALLDDLRPAVYSSQYYLAQLLLALSSLFCAWQLQQRSQHWATQVSLLWGAWRAMLGWVMLGWGLLWWAIAQLEMTRAELVGDAIMNGRMLLLLLTAGLLQLGWLRGQWGELAAPLRALPALVALLALAQLDVTPHLFHFWAWALLLPGSLLLLYWQDEAASTQPQQHLISALTGWGIFTHELVYLLQQHIPTEVYRISLFAIALSALLAGQRALRWPVQQHTDIYLRAASWPAVTLLIGWGGYSALAAGDSGWAYLPIINPLDLAQILTGLALCHWWRAQSTALPTSTPSTQVLALGVLGAGSFVWLNAMLLRTLHHYHGVAYQYTALKQSMLVQMSLSLFWTVLALLLMLLATRQQLRAMWLCGAGLLAVVIGKLFLLDLSHISGLERIASFIGVGVLLLLIGYVAPLPPEDKTHD